MPEPTADDTCLSLPARAEHLRVVRQVVGAFAEALGFGVEAVGDVELAVTEACSNVVRHAYAQEQGRLDLTMNVVDGRLVVLVADTGVGIGGASDGDGDGLGLPLMATIADEFEIRNVPGDGSEVRMAFAPPTDTLEPA